MSTGRVAHDGDVVGVEPDHLGIGAQPTDGEFRVVELSGENLFGGEAIFDGGNGKSVLDEAT